MGPYARRNAVPLALEALFIASCLALPGDLLVYANFLFYFALFLYFLLHGDFSPAEWMRSLRGGPGFWVPVLLTLLGLIGAVAATSILEGAFADLDAGMLRLPAHTPFEMALFAISTTLLPGIVEETFFRKGLISFAGRPALILTTLLGMLLFALEHALAPWGIALVMVWSLPLTVSYLATRNVHVPMTAHLIGDVLANGPAICLGFAAVLGLG